MASINEALQKFNPGLIGSQLTNDHMSEYSGNLTKNNVRDFNDDTRSIMSMQSNITGISRKTAVSMLNMDSIISSNSQKKLPGTLNF